MMRGGQTAALAAVAGVLVTANIPISHAQCSKTFTKTVGAQVKVNPDGATCTTEGAFALESTTSKIHVCTGPSGSLAWQPIGGGVDTSDSTAAMPTCDASTEGTIVYDKEGGAWKGCDGTNYTPLVTAGKCGQSSGMAAASCKEIMERDSCALFQGTGAKWIERDAGAAQQVWCDNDLSGGGWELAMNLDTSDGHVMWAGNPKWVTGAAHGDVAGGISGNDVISTAYTEHTSFTQILLVVHEQGSVLGWNRFAYSKTGESFAAQFAVDKSDNNIGTHEERSLEGGLWSQEKMVRSSAELIVNRYSGRSQDLDRLCSIASCPNTNNFGGGIGNWHDFYNCGTSGGAIDKTKLPTVESGYCSDGGSYRTAGEVTNGWGCSYGSNAAGWGTFGSDTWKPMTCQQNNSGDQANWSAANGHNYDYAIFLR